MKALRPAIGVAAVLLCTLLLAASASAAASISVVKIKHDRDHGSAVVLVKVAAPGRLYLSGKRVVRRSVESSGVGIAKLEVTAKGTARKRLRANGTATVAVEFKFVTSEGSIATTWRSIRLAWRAGT